MAQLGLSSGAVYDALHFAAAEKVEAIELVTFNGTDFRRMPPQEPTQLVVLA
jgi:predicted nucleic acid-binding protein